MRDAQAFAPVLVANGGEAEATPWVKSKADVAEMLMKMKNWPELRALASLLLGGAAGNRTRVLRHSLKTSPCAVRYASTRISQSRELAEMTIPVAVSVPISPATELIG